MAAATDSTLALLLGMALFPLSISTPFSLSTMSIASLPVSFSSSSNSFTEVIVKVPGLPPLKIIGSKNGTDLLSSHAMKSLTDHVSGKLENESLSGSGMKPGIRGPEVSCPFCSFPLILLMSCLKAVFTDFSCPPFFLHFSTLPFPGHVAQYF